MSNKKLSFDLLIADPETIDLGVIENSFFDLVNNEFIEAPGHVCSATHAHGRRVLIFCGYGHNIVVTEREANNKMPIFKLYAKPKIIEQFGSTVVNAQLRFLKNHILVDYDN